MGIASWRPDVEFLLDLDSDPNDPAALESWVPWGAKLTQAAGIRRGRPYVLDRNTAGAPSFTVIDIDELLNADNTASPYYGKILPYRRAAFQAMWPNTTIGNLLNDQAIDPAASDGGDPAVNCAYDPTLESTTVGTQPRWLWAQGGATVAVSTTVAWQGSRSARWSKSAVGDGMMWHAPCIPGRQYTTSVYVRQSTAGTVRLSVASPKSSATTATTTTVGSWVRLSVTYTAWSMQHEVTLTAQGAMSAGYGYADGFQHEQAVTASAFTTAGPVLYTLFNGHVEEFPRAWKHAGLMGWSGVKCVDAMGVLNRFKLDTEIRAAIQATEPAYWWPLSEPDGTTLWGEQSGNTGLSMERVVGVYGMGGAQFNAGVAHGIPGDPDGTGVELAADTDPLHTSVLYGAHLRSNGLTIPLSQSSGSWGRSFSFWWRGPMASSMLGVGPMAGVRSSDGSRAFSLWTNPFSNEINIAGINAASGSWVSFGLHSDTVHHLAATSYTSGGSERIRLYVDGVKVIDRTTAVTPVDIDGVCANICGWTWGSVHSSDTSHVDGTYAHFAIWDRELSAAEVSAQYAAGSGGVGETSGQRVSRYLDYYQWTGGKSIDVGRSVMGVNSLAKKTELLVACQDVQDSENGDFFADGHGRIRFHGRDRRYKSTAPKVVFGEDVAAGEVPYTENITYGMDRMRIYNEVTVTNSGGVTSVRSDATSRKRFFPNAYERKVNLADNNEAVAFADWLLFTNKDPRQRVAGLVLDPVSHPAMWPTVLRLELGDRVTVRRRPKGANAGAGLVMSTDYFIEQIEHTGIDMENCKWQVNLSLSRVDVNPFILDDATYGVMDSTNALVY